MRRLLLLRHAKAAPSAGRDDYDRALTDVGREDAHRMGAWLADHGHIPDIVVYSSAERTRETAEIVASAWPKLVKSIAEPRLYEATRHLTFTLAEGLPDSAAVAMFVGHNPSIGDIASQFTAAGAAAERIRMAAKFPTTGLAVLDFPVDRWVDIASRSARLLRFVTPSDLRAHP
jgi:phosphohistidine phosphatase